MMNNRSKSTLFLIEQLIVVAVFAICAVACVRILTTAYFYARDSRDISHALIVAETAAESFKAVSGDIGRTASVIGGHIGQFDGSEAVVVYFDSDWHISNRYEAHYVLYLADREVNPENSRLAFGQLSVLRLTGSEDVLVNFEVAARKGGQYR